MQLPKAKPSFQIILDNGIWFIFTIALMSLFAVSTQKILQKENDLNQLNTTQTQTTENLSTTSTKLEKISYNLATTSAALATTSAAYQELLNQDQYLINQQLEKDYALIEHTYSQSLKSYEALLKLKEVSDKTQTFDDQYTKAISYLADRNYASASVELVKLSKNANAERSKIAAAFSIPKNVTINNTPPGSGYRRQQVQTPIGNYLVSIITADLNSTRVIVDTATDGECGNDCPVLSLGDYVSRNGAFAGINGSYFCPATYPSCAGKTNSFDTLVMNKNKKYINSDNNVYSTIPAVIFQGNSARFVGKTQEWGRDTGVDAVLTNHPLIVSGNNVVFNGDGDPKKRQQIISRFCWVNRLNCLHRPRP